MAKASKAAAKKAAPKKAAKKGGTNSGGPKKPGTGTGAKNVPHKDATPIKLEKDQSDYAQ